MQQFWLHPMVVWQEIIVSGRMVASFPGLLSPNAVEGLVKLVRRMMSGGRLKAWHFRWTAVLHARRDKPCLQTSTWRHSTYEFTRPSIALGDRRPGNEARRMAHYTILLWSHPWIIVYSTRNSQGKNHISCPQIVAALDEIKLPLNSSTTKRLCNLLATSNSHRCSACTYLIQPSLMYVGFQRNKR